MTLMPNKQSDIFTPKSLYRSSDEEVAKDGRVDPEEHMLKLMECSMYKFLSIIMAFVILILISLKIY